ncbi:MAG: hypothetical protein JXR83_23205 [Deltaproteobacteria bacterium]|nr:hypothetical protein [Deltaproteobacteria bacterium]
MDASRVLWPGPAELAAIRPTRVGVSAAAVVVVRVDTGIPAGVGVGIGTGISAGVEVGIGTGIPAGVEVGIGTGIPAGVDVRIGTRIAAGVEARIRTGVGARQTEAALAVFSAAAVVAAQADEPAVLFSASFDPQALVVALARSPQRQAAAEQAELASGAGGVVAACDAASALDADLGLAAIGLRDADTLARGAARRRDREQPADRAQREGSARSLARDRICFSSARRSLHVLAPSISARRS